jgi:hypothetical protein
MGRDGHDTEGEMCRVKTGAAFWGATRDIDRRGKEGGKCREAEAAQGWHAAAFLNAVVSRTYQRHLHNRGTVTLHNTVAGPTWPQFLSHFSGNVASPPWVHIFNSNPLSMFIDFQILAGHKEAGQLSTNYLGVGRTNHTHHLTAFSLDQL